MANSRPWKFPVRKFARPSVRSRSSVRGSVLASPADILAAERKPPPDSECTAGRCVLKHAPPDSLSDTRPTFRSASLHSSHSTGAICSASQFRRDGTWLAIGSHRGCAVGAPPTVRSRSFLSPARTLVTRLARLPHSIFYQPSLPVITPISLSRTAHAAFAGRSAFVLRAVPSARR